MSGPGDEAMAKIRKRGNYIYPDTEQVWRDAVERGTSRGLSPDTIATMLTTTSIKPEEFARNATSSGSSSNSGSGTDNPTNGASAVYTRFLQKAGNGNWAVFRYRDDLDERRPYWALTTTGALQYVDPWDGGAPTASRFANDQNKDNSQLGRSGGSTGVLGIPALAYLAGRQQFGDPLAGNEKQGRALSDDNEMLAAVRATLSNKGISGEKVRSDATTAGDMLDWAHSQVGWEKSPATGKPTTVAEAFLSQRGKESFPRIKFEELGSYFTPTELAAVRVMQNKVAESLLTLPGTTDDPNLLASLRTAGLPRSGGGGTSTGSGGGNTAALPPGKFNGETVDADMLKTYLSTQWEPTFNAWVGNFRDAGAAGYFLSWLSRASNTFLGQYEGFLGKQALAGKMPEGDYSSFLSAKAKGITNSQGSAVGDIGGDAGAKTFGPATDSVNRTIAAAAAKAKADAATASPMFSAQPPVDLSGTTVNPSADAEKAAAQGMDMLTFLPETEGMARGGFTTAPVMKVGDVQQKGVPNPETLYNPMKAPLYIVPDNGVTSPKQGPGYAFGTQAPTAPDVDYDIRGSLWRALGRSSPPPRPRPPAANWAPDGEASAPDANWALSDIASRAYPAMRPDDLSYLRGVKPLDVRGMYAGAAASSPYATPPNRALPSEYEPAGGAPVNAPYGVSDPSSVSVGFDRSNPDGQTARHEIAHAMQYHYVPNLYYFVQALRNSGLTAKNFVGTPMYEEAKQFLEGGDDRDPAHLYTDIAEGFAFDPSSMPEALRKFYPWLTDGGLPNQRTGGGIPRYAYGTGTPAWQRKEGQNPNGGLNDAGRASAKAEGHDLKRPVTSGDNPRRASFLARMGGMPGPERKSDGTPTRLLLALQAWGASSKSDAKSKARAISARNDSK